jgi:ribosomal protein S18 acetylase RimI-like enzyme
MGETPPWQIGPARPDQHSRILALLPRLADFEIPAHREARHLWEADAAQIKEYFAGKTKHLHLLCASTGDDQIAGVAVFALRPELLTDAPSAHLEALAVDAAFEGRGVASALIDACHAAAQTLGARSMSLHVFDTNQRALRFYEHKGYKPELRRCIKWFEEP